MRDFRFRPRVERRDSGITRSVAIKAARKGVFRVWTISILNSRTEFFNQYVFKNGKLISTNHTSRQYFTLQSKLPFIGHLDRRNVTLS